MNTKQVIETYYRGWAKRDQDQVRSVVAENRSHASPDGYFSDANSFLSQCWVLGEGLTNVNFKKSVLTENEAFVILEWEAQNGSFINAEYIRLENNKIRAILVITNSPDLAKAMRQQ